MFSVCSHKCVSVKASVMQITVTDEGLLHKLHIDTHTCMSLIESACGGQTIWPDVFIA